MACAQHPSGPCWFPFTFLVPKLMTFPPGSCAGPVDLNYNSLANRFIAVSAGPIPLIPQIPIKVDNAQAVASAAAHF